MTLTFFGSWNNSTAAKEPEALPKKQVATTKQSKIDYPEPPQHGGVTEVLHGVTVADPWRSLEEHDSATTQSFIAAQNALSMARLSYDEDGIQKDSHGKKKQRKSLEASVRQSLCYERNSCPHRQPDGWYYWLHNSGLQARDVMMRSRSPLGSDAVAFYDPAKQQAGESLYSYSWSQTGRLFCAVVQIGGSDWQTIRTLDCQTGDIVEAELHHSKFTFGAAFVGDEGFLYKRIMDIDSVSDDADGQFGLYYHVIGTEQRTDVCVWTGSGKEAKSLLVGRPRITERRGGNRTWLFVDIYRNTNPEVEALLVELPMEPERGRDGEEQGSLLSSLINKERRWLTRGFEGMISYIGTLDDDTHLFLSTCQGSSRGKIVAVSAQAYDNTKPDAMLELDTIIPERSDNVLDSAHLVASRLLVLVYLKDACADVLFYDVKRGKEVHLPHTTAALPRLATISSVTCSAHADDFYLAVETFTQPPYLLRGFLSSTTSGSDDDEEDRVEITLARVTEAGQNRTGQEEEEELICKQTFYFSNGIQIPLFLCHAKKLDLTSQPRPTLLHAYGGFATPLMPHFDPFFATFMRHLGGVVAVACIRGGGEYGAQWHQAATGPQRIVAFQDFENAARFLHEQRITTPALTASYGVSNGGLLVGACMNRHPELFQAVLPCVGVFDLVRFHRFTLGRYWLAEYGDPTKKETLPAIHSISPLHNVDQTAQYPNILISTAGNDTRVVPAHSLKFLAQLQWAATRQSNTCNVILGRIYENAGHEASSSSTHQKIVEIVDRLFFLSDHL